MTGCDCVVAGSKEMTRIEKAVEEVSDLYDFYRQIPKIADRGPVRE